MYEIEVSVKGISPLLFNKFVEAELEGKSKKSTGAQTDKKAEDKLYMVDGKIYTPATHFEMMLVNAGKDFKVKGKGKATYSKIVGSSLEVVPAAIVHKIQSWTPFTISAVNPMTRGRMLVTRPMMDAWELDFKLKVLDDQLPEGVVKEILDFGGLYVGIGDWRPQKKGKYGKFIVTKFKKIS